jgi:small redox-active disulfide protein 2
MLIIKILGAGCAKCNQLEAETRAALAAILPAIPHEIVKVTDYAAIASYGIMATPALVINEQIKSYGRIPKREQITKWLLELQPHL